MTTARRTTLVRHLSMDFGYEADVDPAVLANAILEAIEPELVDEMGITMVEAQSHDRGTITIYAPMDTVMAEERTTDVDPPATPTSEPPAEETNTTHCYNCCPTDGCSACDTEMCDDCRPNFARVIPPDRLCPDCGRYLKDGVCEACREPNVGV